MKGSLRFDFLTLRAVNQNIGDSASRVVGRSASKPGRGNNKEPKIDMVTFISCWHIHDIETKDNTISRTTKMLNLDYYDMDVTEMERRLEARSSADADPVLDFNSEDLNTNLASVPILAGERAPRVAVLKKDQGSTGASERMGNKTLLDVKVALTQEQWYTQQLTRAYYYFLRRRKVQVGNSI